MKKLTLNISRLYWRLQSKRLLGFLSSEPVAAPGEFSLQPSDGLPRPSLTLLQTVQLAHRHLLSACPHNQVLKSATLLIRPTCSSV